MLLVGAPDASSGVTPDPTEPTRSFLTGDDAMFARSFANGFVRTFALPLSRLATVAGLAMILGATASAQEADAERTARKREPIVFTVDVAEDLAGKFVPTMVKPEHTQPERGSFFVTEGRIFPAGTIQGDGANFDPNQTGHIGVWICRGTHLVAAHEIPAAPLWVTTAQLYVLGRQGKEQLATEGVEGSGTVGRIVTGGAGNFAGWTGEQRQAFLGFNSTGGVNVRVTFTLWPPAR
jgi:hypothetical protein